MGYAQYIVSLAQSVEPISLSHEYTNTFAVGRLRDVILTSIHAAYDDVWTRGLGGNNGRRGGALVKRVSLFYTWGEATSQNLWPRYDRHFVGIT